MKPQSKLTVVPREAKPYDPVKGRRTISQLHGQLLRAVVRYIEDGSTSGEKKERLREASDLSGLPRVILETKVVIKTTIQPKS